MPTCTAEIIGLRSATGWTNPLKLIYLRAMLS